MEEKEEMTFVTEIPERDEKIVKVTYPDGSSCDVIFTKLAEPVSAEDIPVFIKKFF